MKKILLLTLFATLTSLQIFAAQKSLYLDDSQPIEVRIEDALKRMTLEEKIAMIHAQSKFSSPGCERLGIPELWMSDGPHGVRAEFEWDTWNYAHWSDDSITAFPALTCLAATFDTAVARQYGHALGEEARYRNKEIILGPGVNIYRTPLNGRNFEYMGEDPYLSSQMVVPYIQGVQSNGVSACLKHYALNNQEEWRGHINVMLSQRALQEIYLPAFKAAVEKGHVWSVMGSYNKFDGQHCTTNDSLMNKILKRDWHFNGLVMSDWGSTHDTWEAANNGLDLEMGSLTNGLTAGKANAYNSYYMAQPLLDSIKAGKIDAKVVDDKVRRILRVIFRTSMSKNRPWGCKNTPEHWTTALKVAEEGIVLMKNDNNFFPIKPGQYRTIAVIGENATRRLTIGGGSSELKAQKEVSPLQGLIATYGADHIVYSRGYASGASAYGRVLKYDINRDSLFNAAVDAAKNADVVIFIGGLNKNHHQDCEGGDRLDYGLPFNQDKLINAILKVNKNTGIVLINGNAMATPWISEVPAYIQSWYLGSTAGEALANVISGKVNPSGKLPFTFGKKLDDYGSHSFGKIAYPGDSINEEYKEGILVGYRWFDTKKIKPEFAFGHGLSYTTFAIGKASTNKKEYGSNDIINVTVNVTNIGNMVGAEVIQLYATQKKPSEMRPVKELKAFVRVNLQPGETKAVTLKVPTQSLAYFSDKKHHWTLESDMYMLQVGDASDNIVSRVAVKVK